MVSSKSRSSSRSSKSSSSRGSGSSGIVSSSSSMSQPSVKFTLVLMRLLSFIIPVLTLYYVYQIDRESCKCIRDWRVDYIKAFLVITISVNVIMLLRLLINGMMSMASSPVLVMVVGLLSLLIAVGSIINVYAIYTYVGDLDETKCECAVSGQRNIHNFLWYWRYVMVFGVVILVLSQLMLLV